ncbi:MAG TPA: phage portal protein [Spirillospora sp.]|nr:phage portal protein [Spirillospora sp.]
MTAPGVSLLPALSGATFPAPSIPGLSDDEQRLVTGLSAKLTFLSTQMLIRDAYYNGAQRLANLGISIPPQLAGVRTVVDWPRVVVDKLVERLVVDGFRLPDATDIDTELQEHWEANDLNAEFPLCLIDALVFGRGYMIVGSPDEPGDSPLVTCESPLNMTVAWDPRTRRIRDAYQAYEVEGVFRSVLYTPDQTIHMSRDSSTGGGPWQIDDRDQHGFGEPPVVRFVNRARTAAREGRSEITPAVMNTTDAACRSLLGMEIAREVYAIPRLAILGADESDYQDPTGQPKTAIQMAMTKILALERDEDGNLPTLQQLTAFDPSVFTKIIDQHAQLMASHTGYPPSYFGLTSTANPASADAIRVSENGIVAAAVMKQNQFGSPLQAVMRLVWRFANGGAQVPAEMKRLKADWEPAATPTPAATTDSLFKQAQMGAIPPTSDVTLKALGWNAVDRARLEVDRKVDVGAQVLAELATSLQAKEARTDITVARDINPQAAKATVNPATGNVESPAAPAAG